MGRNFWQWVGARSCKERAKYEKQQRKTSLRAVGGRRRRREAGGKPVGYLQARSRIWTPDYREQIQLAVRDGLEPGLSEYSQLSPCGHSAITDTSIKRTAANSPAKTNYRRLTEINFRYNGLSLMRTLPRGPSSVRYKGSWLERVQRSNRSATLSPSLQYTYVYCHLITWMCVHLSG